MIVGIDEVGRGAWAGPLVVGAVLLGGETIEGLTDSKKLSKKQRELLNVEIRQKATAIGLGWVSAKQIDVVGLSRALKLAARRALGHIHQDYHEIIIDGTVMLVDNPKATLMKKADLLIPCVSAASIIAKVARDNYMMHLGNIFPEYKFSQHVGYGTLAHRQAIERHGALAVHRFSFAPLSKYVKETPAIGTLSKTSHTTKQIGDAAETVAADYLRKHSHKLLERNWRTKACEIDIISEHKGTVYFTEVKYRKTNAQGGGLAAITPRKQKQMKFAAELFAVNHGLTNTDLRLSVIEVAGNPLTVTSSLELS